MEALIAVSECSVIFVHGPRDNEHSLASVKSFGRDKASKIQPAATATKTRLGHSAGECAIYHTHLRRLLIKYIATPTSIATTIDRTLPPPSMSMSTPTRPKRPLSAFNLFYRFKRGKIIELQPHHGNGSDEHKEIVRQIVMTAPGLEDCPAPSSDDVMKKLRRDTIRSALVNNLLPTDNSKRYHRKTHDAMLSFLEMNKIMCSAWKSVDDFGRSVFEELAEEGKQDQLKRLAEYEKMYPKNSPLPKMKKKKKRKMESNGNTPKARCVSTSPTTVHIPHAVVHEPKVSSNEDQVHARLSFDQRNASSENEDIWDVLPYVSFSSEEEEMLQNEKISQVTSDDFMKLIASIE